MASLREFKLADLVETSRERSGTLTATTVANGRRSAGTANAHACASAPVFHFPKEPAPGARQSGKQEAVMNLFVWLPAMFALGIAGMGVCYAFIFACEDI